MARNAAGSNGRHTRRRLALVSLAWSCASALVVGAVMTPGQASVLATASAATVPRVMVVMMENKSYSQVIGQGDQPYTNGLASQYGLATNSYAFGHPSLPNYLDIVSGSNQGVTDDNDPSSHSFRGVRTIADQLAAAGFSARAYAQNLPSDPTTSSGEYAVRHFPWEYFPGTAITVKDASAMMGDLNSANPPDFVWYTPNLINDEHDGTVQQGDAFLSSFIRGVQTTAWYKAGGQIIIEWDEGTDNAGINGSHGGHVATIVVSAATRGRSLRDSAAVNTAGILRSIEDRYGLAHLANAANSANGTIDSLLTGSSRSFTSAARATAAAGRQFSFPVTTTGTPTPRIKKKGRLPRGMHFRNNHNGTATIWGTSKPHDAPGTYAVTIIATYGRGKTKQVMTQFFTLTLSG